MQVMKWVYLLSWLSGVSGSLAAQRVVTGQVVDGATGAALSGAWLSMVGTDIRVASDTGGHYTLYFPNEGPMAIRVELAGYRRAVVRPQAGEYRRVELVGKVPRLPAGVPAGPYDGYFSGAVGGDTAYRAGVYHAAERLSGLLPGVQVLRPGGDPNEDYLIRVRGLSTLSAQTGPLVVVDGLPEQSLYLLDPAEIASVRVRRSGFEGAAYGLRGSSGVLEVETMPVADTGGLRVRYEGSVAQDFVDRYMPLAGPDRFVANGGPDFGRHTDWQAGVTRVPVSTHHRLTLSGSGKRRMAYLVSLGYRDREGVLLESGYGQYSGRAKVRWTDGAGRIRLQAGVYGHRREARFSFPEAMRYAVTINPTAPERSEEVLFEPFGGWFETFTFGMVNPVGLLAQNRHIGTWHQTGGQMQGTVAVAPGITLGAALSTARQQRLGGRYLHPQSIFEEAFLRAGSWWQYSDMRRQYLGTMHIKGSHRHLRYRFGAERQRHGYERLYRDRDSVGLFRPTFAGLSEGLTPFQADVHVAGARNSAAFFGELELDRRVWSLQARLRREGTNLQERQFRWGTFHGVRARVRVSDWWAEPPVEATVHVDYGRSGGLYNAVHPALSGVVSRPHHPVVNGGEYLPALNFFGNTDFRWERKKAWEVGMTWKFPASGWQGQAVWYTDRATGLVVPQPYYIASYLAGYIPYNTGELGNRGIECQLGGPLLRRGAFSWWTHLQASRQQTKVYRFAEDRSKSEEWLIGDFALGGGAPPRHLVAEGQALGQLYGAVFLGVDPFGVPRLSDLDGNTYPDAYQDAKVLGNALPEMTLGWQHQLQRGPWVLDLSFRGLFGHRLVSDHRLARENIGFPQQHFVITRYFQEGQQFSGGFSDHYLERADFVRLDYASLGYRLQGSWGSGRLYLAGQRLLTLTRYTGLDPEPRMERPGQPFQVGLERGYTYAPNRTVVFGLVAEWPGKKPAKGKL